MSYVNPSADLPIERGSFWWEQVSPWLTRVLFVGALSCAIIGALAICSHAFHIPKISGFFKPLSPPGDIALAASGGTVVLIMTVAWACRMLRKKTPDLRQVFIEIGSLSKELETRNEEKLYYSKTSKQLKTSKRFIWKKNRMTLIRLPNGHYHLKTKGGLGVGASKHVFLECNVNNDMNPEVRTVEKKPPKNHELEIYEALKESPFVVKCLGVVKNTSKKRVLILEYCEKGTFMQAKAKLTSSERFQVFEDCFRGLADLHKAGYLHLDLHGNNLFVIKDSRGRLADFGSSRPISTFSSHEEFQHFMPHNEATSLPMCMPLIPPEIVKNIQRYEQQKELVNVSEKADIWSLGKVLAKHLCPSSPTLAHVLKCQERFTLSGFNQFVPFALNPSELQNYHNMLRQNYPTEPSASNQLENLIWHMLHPNPDERPTAVEAANILTQLKE